MQDRIKQMAVESGLLEPRDEWATVPADYRAALEGFARLVAEDCARVADQNDFGPIPHHIGDNLRARYAETKEG